jgi:hypothetical protein
MNVIAERANHARYRPGLTGGHYESFYLRANHPSRPLAFWIRYTVFVPQVIARDRPGGAIGELWSVFFDGERNDHCVVKRELPIADCRFADGPDVTVGDARLTPSALTGSAEFDGRRLAWNLTYKGGGEPLLLLPEWAYDGRIAKAQSLVPRPLARFSGTLTVDGEDVSVDAWTGSQNHNWGVKHTDHYAFGQVAGFDDAPDSFLEVATARLKIGPVWTPFLTMLVLRHAGREYRLNGLRRMLRAQASIEFFDWRFATGDRRVQITGRVWAPRERMIGFRYYNPPGGDKHCLNTKIGACELRLKDKANGDTVTLKTEHRTLFELMPPTTDAGHGIAIRA